MPGVTPTTLVTRRPDPHTRHETCASIQHRAPGMCCLPRCGRIRERPEPTAGVRVARTAHTVHRPDQGGARKRLRAVQGDLSELVDQETRQRALRGEIGFSFSGSEAGNFTGVGAGNDTLFTIRASGEVWPGHLSVAAAGCGRRECADPEQHARAGSHPAARELRLPAERSHRHLRLPRAVHRRLYATTAQRGARHVNRDGVLEAALLHGR